ncbi:MAG: hypothetical protein NTW37_01885 [Proteobacteria bacterium]|nr:hypothetical protein [Pseudomonadota bacterium]
MKRIATRGARRTMGGASMLAAALALPASATVMAQQPYPSRPVRLVCRW